LRLELVPQRLAAPGGVAVEGFLVRARPEDGFDVFGEVVFRVDIGGGGGCACDGAGDGDYIVVLVVRAWWWLTRELLRVQTSVGSTGAWGDEPSAIVAVARSWTIPRQCRAIALFKKRKIRIQRNV
jgi:hypothetical protein